MLTVSIKTFQRFPDVAGVALAMWQQAHPIADPLKQRYPQKSFQTPDLTADGAFRQGQFFGGPGETAMTCRSLECHQ
ncbi:hypothetical protein J2S30_001883 [Herbaspirillum rubrisubalbicans]|nr:hypothetical protein [Herbaspirillum rubrisubalbicans]